MMKIRLAKRAAAFALGCAFAFTSVPFIVGNGGGTEAEAADYDTISVSYIVHKNQDPNTFADILSAINAARKPAVTTGVAGTLTGDTGTSTGESGTSTDEPETGTPTTDSTALKYNGDLENYAIERAEDIALLNSDTRPDGSSPYEIAGDDVSLYLNYIGAAGSTPAAVWAADAKTLDTQYRSAAIGHVSYNGQEYYVLALSTKESENTKVDYDNTGFTSPPVQRNLAYSNVGSIYAKVASTDGSDPTQIQFNSGVASDASDKLSVPLKSTVNARRVSYAVSPKNSSSVYDVTGISQTISATDLSNRGISVSTSGAVTGNTVGANYSISYKAVVAGTSTTLTIPVEVIAADLSNSTMSFRNSSEQYYANGSAIKPDITITLGGKTLTEGTDYDLAYTNNSPAVTITKAQTATVTATGKGDYTGTKSLTFTIQTNNGGNLKDAVITVANADAVIYDGKEKKPAVTVALHGVTVPADSYTVSYANNIKAGKTATVKVTAKAAASTDTTPAKYSGTKTQNFEIKPADLSSASFEFPDSDNKSNTSPQYSYTGADIKPQPTVKVGSNTLKSGTDFTYSYSNNRAIGTGATVIVTGKGNYDSTTSASTTFEITQGDITKATVTPTPAAFTYNGQRQYPAAVVVSVAGHQLQQGTDYTITAFPDSVNAGTYTFTVTGINNFRTESTGTTQTNGSSSGSANNNSNQSSTGTTTTTPGTITGSYTITTKDASSMYKSGDLAVTGLSTLTYNGNTRKPAIAVVDNVLGTELVSETDYTRTDSNNKTPGTASVTLTFKGNYTGTVTATYRIKPKKTSITKVTGNKKKATVKYKKVSGISGYQVKSGTNRAVTKSTKTKNTTKTSYTMTSLKSKKRYYFKVRTYYTGTDGKKVYSSWSGVKSAKTK